MEEQGRKDEGRGMKGVENGGREEREGRGWRIGEGRKGREGDGGEEE